MSDEAKPLGFHEFKKQVGALGQFRGRGTELISVYITPGYPIGEVTGKLRDEFGQAANIKSSSTRKNVQGALEKIMHYLKGFKAPPEMGIAVFCGNISKVEGKQDLQLFSVIPPFPVPVQFYRCEDKFVLDPLEDLVAPLVSYGMVVIDGKDAAVGLLKGKTIKIVKRVHNLAPSKSVKGGQSAARFDRIREDAIHEYHKRVGEAMNMLIAEKGFQGFIVGGPGPHKEGFLKEKPFDYRTKIIGVLDVSYTEDYGLRELLDKSSELIAQQEAVMEKKLVDDFMREVAQGKLAAYGVEKVKEVLQSGKASKLVLSEDIDTEIATELTKLAEGRSIEIALVSTETAEGKTFLATFQGVGAFLRYR
jgi:peptide chain release factor subunit 1